MSLGAADTSVRATSGHLTPSRRTATMIAPWTAAATPIAPRTAIAIPIAPRRPRRAAGRWHIRHFRQTRHTRRVHYHVASRTAARTLAAQRGLSAQCQVDHAALAAIHGVEAERSVRALHIFRHGKSTQSQFFDAQQTIVVGVERNL